MVNTTEQIQIMKNKISMDIKKLNLPLPMVKEGFGVDDKKGHVGE